MTLRDFVKVDCAADGRSDLCKIKNMPAYITYNSNSKSYLNISQGKKGENGLPGVDGLPGTAVRALLILWTAKYECIFVPYMVAPN